MKPVTDRYLPKMILDGTSVPNHPDQVGGEGTLTKLLGIGWVRNDFRPNLLETTVVAGYLVLEIAGTNES